MQEIERIRGSLSRLLAGRKVLVIVTASIAMYKVIDLARLLIRHGAEVRILMSRKASKLINPELFTWATGTEPIVKLTGRAEHVELANWCDICVVAPCTLNTMAKFLYGVSDQAHLLTLQAVVGLGKKILLVPCMNLAMWRSEIAQRIVRELQELKNVYILSPKIEEEKAKFPDVEIIVEKIIDLCVDRRLEGKTILVTGGATREFIDPVKYISTPSSGLTGIYFTREASAQGARTILVLGYCSRQYEKLLESVDNVEVIRVKTTAEMYNHVKYVLETRSVDIVVFTAAPLDYMLSSQPHAEKIESDKVEKIVIELVRAPKVIELVRDLDCVKVGFKAEWNVPESELIRRARLRLVQYSLDMVVAHDVSKGLGFETTHDSVLIVDKFGLVTRLEKVHKRELARTVLRRASALFSIRRS